MTSLASDGQLPLSERPGFSRVRFLQPLALAQFICSFAGSNMNVMITDISDDLDTTTKGVQTAITLFLLTMAILMMEAFSQLEPEAQAAVLPALGEIRRRMDYETYGGAHLLGVNGVVVIAHGSSSHVAIANGIRIAHDGVARDLVGKVASRLAGA